MSDKPTTLLAVAPKIEPKLNPIQAWYDADTDEKRIAAVQKFPELANIFTLAETLKNSK